MRTAFARGWRQLRRDGRRYVIAVVALGFGVALLFGTSLTASAISAQLRAGVSSLGGIGDVGLVPSVGATYVPERDQAQVARLPGVDSSIGTLTVDTTASGPSTAGKTLSVTGYPTSFNVRLAGLVHQGRLPAGGTDEVLVPTDIADSLGVGLGDPVTVATYAGSTRLVVVGLVDPTQLGALAYDNVFVDLKTSQSLFALPGQLTRVDVVLSPGYGTGRWEADVVSSLPAGLQLQDTSALTSTFAPLLSVVTLVLYAAGVVTLAVATMLAGAAFEGAVRSRHLTYGAMRAVGASGRWLAQSVLVEALLLALVAAALGLPIGLGVSVGLTSLLTSVGNLPPSPLHVAAWQVLLAVCVAVVAGLVGAARAIRSVVRQAPLTTLVAQPPAPRRGDRTLLVTGIVLVVVGATLGLVGGTVVRLVAFGLLLAAAAVLAPGAVVLLARAVRPRSWPLAVAADRLGRMRTQTVVASVAAVVVALSAALTVGVGAISTAMQTQLVKQFGADVQISSPIATGDAVERRVMTVPGVGRVTATLTDDAVVTAAGHTEDVSFMAVDPASYFATSQLPWRTGNDLTTPAAMRSDPAAAVLPTALLDATGARVGDQVSLVRGNAHVRLTVVGTYASLSTGNQVVISRTAAGRLGVTGANGWNVQAAPGQSPVVLRDTVASALSDIPGLEIITASEMRERATAQLASYAAAAFGLVVVGLVLGAVGTGGLLALSTAQRDREIGTLRAVGASRRRIRQMVVGEVLLVSVAASAVGLLVGQGAGLVLIRVIGSSLGATLDPATAPLPFLGIATLSTLALLVAAVAPSRRAAQVDPVVALATD